MRPKPLRADTPKTAAPIRVLIVDTAIAFGGTLVVARNLLKHLDQNRIECSLVSACTDGFVTPDFASGRPVRLLASRVNYVTLGRWKMAISRRIQWASLRRVAAVTVMVTEFLANAPYLFRLVRLYRELRPDIVHLNNYTMEPFWAARLLGIPIIYHLHGFVSPHMDGSGRRNFRHVHTFISISRAVTESATHAGIDPARICEIPNFIDRVIDSEPPALPDTLAIGIFGRVTHWKGQKEFIRAAIQILGHRPDLKVYVVGDASDGDPQYLHECIAIARSSPYPAQIEFTGRVTDVASYYKRCTVVVHASILPEPFGMVLIEAMAEARPVVASVYGAAPEIIIDGVDGFLVDPKNSKAMVERIEGLLANPSLAREMGRKGFEKTRTTYNPQSAAREFERIYTRVAQATH